VFYGLISITRKIFDSKIDIPDVDDFLGDIGIKMSQVPPMPKGEKNGVRNLSSGSFGRGLLSEIFTGEKYPGGLNSSALDFFYIDYWSLRRRSYKLFTENRYAKGLINRLLTNEIHRGLTLESTTNGGVLGLSDEEVNDLTDDIEAKFDIWADNKELVSHDEQSNFGQLQINIRKAALLSGDVLIVLRQHPVSKLPVIELLDGYHIRTPLEKKTRNKIRHGVELDDKGRHVAYYVQDNSDISGIKSVRIPAQGARTGRRVAWMVYGSKIKIDDVRGMPALGVLLQGLKELDRYSDAEQRAAVLNAVQAYFIKKSGDKLGRPPGAGATRRDTVIADSGSGSGSHTYHIDKYLPGVVMEDLPAGHEPVSFSTVRPNVNYRVFEEAMMASFAWCLEIPPNIYRLAFSSNYSASGAEINELKLYLDKARWLQSSDVNKPFYREWFVSATLAGYISIPGFLEVWRNPAKFLELGAWLSSEWSGAIKPSLRRNDDIKGYSNAIRQGFVTRDIATKELFGRKFSTMVKRLNKENQQLVDSLQPLINAGLIKNENTNPNSKTKENIQETDENGEK